MIMNWTLKSILRKIGWHWRKIFVRIKHKGSINLLWERGNKIRMNNHQRDHWLNHLKQAILLLPEIENRATLFQLSQRRRLRVELMLWLSMLRDLSRRESWIDLTNNRLRLRWLRWRLRDQKQLQEMFVNLVKNQQRKRFNQESQPQMFPS